MQKARMTINQVVTDMRSRGLGIGHKALTDGIVSGAFPFGTLLKTNETGRRTFLILRANYETWADENLGPIQ